jgi:hypothetical protein
MQTQRDRAQSIINDLADLIVDPDGQAEMIQDLSDALKNVLNESDGSINGQRYSLLSNLHNACKSIIMACKAAKEDF